MKNILLIDNLKGEILVFSKDLEMKVIQDKHYEYQNDYITFGKDYIEGHNVWFIKSVLDGDFTRLRLEEIVLDFLMKVGD